MPSVLESASDGYLASLEVPTLLVAGTADLRVPAEAEARRIVAAAPEGRCVLHLVEGAGHAGVTDDRLDLRAVMREWRRADCGVVAEAL